MKQPNIPCEKLEGWFSEQPEDRCWDSNILPFGHDTAYGDADRQGAWRSSAGEKGNSIINNVDKKLCGWVDMEWIQLAVVGCFEQG
jgi:hypothetical protein